MSDHYFDQEGRGIGYCDVCNIETEWLEGAPSQLCDDCLVFCEKNDMLVDAVLWHIRHFEDEFGPSIVEEFFSTYKPKPRPESAAPARPAKVIHECLMEFIDAPDLV